MSAFVHSAELSASPAVKAIEANFALVGYARYLKVLEILAGAAEGDDSRRSAAMTWDGWAAALAAQHDALSEFFAFCHEQGAFAVEDDGEQVTVSCDALALYRQAPASPETPGDLTLFTTPEQWAEWFIEDLSYPPKLAHRPENLRMFRRWCASNVTVGEMCAAIQKTIEAGTGLGTAALHGYLQALRAQRIKEANQ